jgi:hypothetical protein
MFSNNYPSVSINVPCPKAKLKILGCTEIENRTINSTKNILFYVLYAIVILGIIYKITFK